jgi:hypothetical protein
MPEQETPEEFRARMRSVGFVPGATIRATSRTVTRPADDPGLDAGRTARETTDELGTVITESDNRRDVIIHPETHVQSLSFQGLEG